MTTDKRPLYIWISVLLANLGALLFFIPNFVLTGSLTLSELLERPDLYMPALYYTLVSLAITIIPVLISKLHSVYKKYIGYGLPIATLLPLAYLVYDYYTCTGKFCDVGDMVLGVLISIGAAVFAFFYTVGIYAPKLKPRFILTIIYIEAILLSGGVLYLSIY